MSSAVENGFGATVISLKEINNKKVKENAASLALDGGWGWIVVFSSFCIRVMTDGVPFTYGIFYTEFLNYFGDSKYATSLVGSIMLSSEFFIGPIAGALTTKYGCRIVAIVGALLTAVGMITSITAPNVTFLCFSFGICTGCGFGFMYLSVMTSVTNYFEKKRSLATSITACGSSFGIILLAPVVEWLTVAFCWQGAMLIIAGFALNCCIFGALLRPFDDTFPKKLKELSTISNSVCLTEKKAKISEEMKKKTSFKVLSSICTSCMTEKKFKKEDFGVVIFGISNCLIAVGFVTPFMYTKHRTIALNITDSTNASYLLSLMGIASIVGRCFFGYLADQPCISRLWICNSTLIFCGIITSLSCFCDTYFKMAVYVILFSATIAPYGSLTTVILSELTGAKKFASIYGYLLFFEGIACLAGSPIVGWIFDHTSSYDIGFHLAGAAIAIGGLLLFFIR